MDNCKHVHTSELISESWIEEELGNVTLRKKIIVCDDCGETLKETLYELVNDEWSMLKVNKQLSHEAA